MKKKIFIGFCGFAFVAMLMINITLVKGSDNTLISLTSLVKKASAECEAGNSTNCPGGSCTFTNNVGECCSSCCPEGKDPDCSTFGCKCV